jgi:hypothetical protein
MTMISFSNFLGDIYVRAESGVQDATDEVTKRNYEAQIK